MLGHPTCLTAPLPRTWPPNCRPATPMPQPSLFGSNDGQGHSLVYYFALPEGWEPNQASTAGDTRRCRGRPARWLSARRARCARCAPRLPFWNVGAGARPPLLRAQAGDEQGQVQQGVHGRRTAVAAEAGVVEPPRPCCPRHLCAHRWTTKRRWRWCSASCTTSASLTAHPRATASSSSPASSTWRSGRRRARCRVRPHTAAPACTAPACTAPPLSCPHRLLAPASPFSCPRHSPASSPPCQWPASPASDKPAPPPALHPPREWPASLHSPTAAHRAL